MDTHYLGIFGDNGANIVLEITLATRAPHTDNMPEVKGNCLTWVFEVLSKLVERNIISQKQLETLTSLINTSTRNYMESW